MSNDPDNDHRNPWNERAAAGAAFDEPPPSVDAPPATLRDPGLVGREALVERVQSAMHSQTVRCTCFSGSSGIGKTLAAKELVARLETAGWSVLAASCYPDMPPLDAWRQVVDAASADVSVSPDTEEILRAEQQQLSAAQRGSAVARDVARRQLFERLATRAGAFGSQRRLVWIDDLQWADPDSVAVLERAMRAQPHWALVATLNTEATEEGAARARQLFVRLERATVAEVGPLHRADVASYLTRALGVAAYEGWVRALHTRSGGHPLFLRELVQALVDRGVALDQWTATPEFDGILPPLLRELLQQRGAQLVEATTRVVRAACLLEGELDVALLCELCDCSRRELLMSFDELARAGILQAQPARPGQWQFVHGLVREAFYEGLEATERAQLHLRAAAAFTDRAARGGGFSLVQAAHHLRQALPLSEPEEVVRACRRAARWQAAQGACLEAARLEAQAFELSEQDDLGSPRDRLAHTLRLGRLYLAGGLLTKSIGVYTRAIERARRLGRPRVQVEAVLGLSAALGWGRHPNHAEERPLIEALSLVPSDSSMHARLLARRAVLRSYRGMAPDEVEMAREAVRLAAKHRSPRDARAWLEANRALHCALQGPAHLEERAELAQRLLALQEQYGLTEHNYSVREELAGERLMQGDRAGHDVLLAGGRAAAAQHPQFAWLHQVACTVPAILEGRWEEAQRRIQKAAEVGALTESPQVRPAALGQELCIRRAQGRAAELLEQIVPVAAGLAWVGAYSQAALAGLYVEAGDLDTARAVFEPHADAWLARPHDNVDDWLITAAELAWVSCRLGDKQRGAQIEERLKPYAHLHAVLPPVNLYAGPIARSLGLLARLRGDTEKAVTLLARGRDACSAVGATVMRDLIDTELESLRPLLSSNLREQTPSTAEPPQPSHQEVGYAAADVAGREPRTGDAFIRRGEGWLVRYRGQENFVGNLVGVRYLAELLAHPQKSLKARTLVDLVTERRSDPASGAAADPSLNLHEGERGDEVIDEQALAAYRDRLRLLDEQLEEAEEFSDVGRVERLGREKEALRKELSRALNIFGRPRATGSRDERARVSCTRAIRKALALLAKSNSALGEHLEASIRTGYECSYAPTESVEWDCQP